MTAHRDPDDQALAQATASVRSFIDALCGHVPDQADLAAIDAELSKLRERLSSRPARDKLAELRDRPALAALFGADRPPIVPPDGGRVEFDPYTFVGGDLHPGSMGATYRRDGNEAVAEVVLGPAFEGPPGRSHGGAVAAIIDEVMGAVNRINGYRAVTASLTVNYRAAAPLGEPLSFRARLAARDGRKITLVAEGTSPAGLFAEASGLFILTTPPDGQAAE